MVVNPANDGAAKGSSQYPGTVAAMSILPVLATADATQLGDACVAEFAFHQAFSPWQQLFKGLKYALSLVRHSLILTHDLGCYSVSVAQFAEAILMTCIEHQHRMMPTFTSLR